MGITNLDRLELGGKEITPPITTQVTKTVGVGKDFEDINDALGWASQVVMVGDGYIELVIDDGTHLLDIPKPAGYVFNNGKVYIRSASGNKANCIFAYADTVDPSFDYTSMILARNCRIGFTHITFDATIGSFSNKGNSWGILHMENCICNSDNIAVKGGTYAVYFNGTNASIVNLSIDGASSSGIYAFLSKVSLQSSGNSIINCGTGASVSTTSSITVPTSTTLTGNSTNFNVPVNEVQYSGSLITNNSAALSFKA